MISGTFNFMKINVTNKSFFYLKIGEIDEKLKKIVFSIIINRAYFCKQVQRLKK
jgi:hypothetical protein